MGIIEAIHENGNTIVSVITGVIATASAITAITKTPSAKKRISIIYRLIELLALNVGRAKDRPVR